MSIRCGIDTGGTFTDLVGLDETTGELTAAKWPSSPRNPVEAIVGVVRESGLSADAISSLILGTTVATNALLQRKGARVIYVTTKGFRDILFIQRINRRYHYSVEWTKPKPLVDRSDCLEVDERINHKGEILVPLAEEKPRALVAAIKERISDQRGYGQQGNGEQDNDNAQQDNDVAIAICLLFSYLNPEHERALKHYLEENLPGVPVSLSHEVAPIWREYERGSTAVADAFIKPILRRYIAGIRQGLESLNITCPWAVMKSNGGHATAEMAENQPVDVVLSGLSGGIIGGRYFGELAAEKNLVTLDMGGTSCDVGVVRNGEIAYNTNYEMEWGMPISAPFVDLLTIGAGGGSIAWIDKGGFLRVGPQSAGADPGPVCYDQGGEQVTVTDANLALGRLNPDYFLGGKMNLNPGKSAGRLSELGKKLDFGVPETAQAIIDLANENMANAIRVMSIERGLDPREFTLVAFGGAGPLHAGGIAELMGMKRVVIPLYPGLCSAFGSLIADFQVDKVWSKHFRSDTVEASIVAGQFENLASAAVGELRAEGFSDTPEIERTISMRYSGQNYEHDVAIEPGPITKQTLDNTFQQFNHLHEQFYGYSIGHEVIELIRFNVKALGRTSKPRLKGIAAPAGAPVAPRQTRGVYFKAEGFVDCPVHRREELPAGFELIGPAIIEEVDSMILVHPGHKLQTNDQGVITLDG
jgi:N-methylhydantoinase A